MRLDVQDIDHPGTATEPGALLEIGGPASRAVSPGFGWLRIYTRPAGVIQMLFAAYFGWMARWFLMNGQFYYPETHYRDKVPGIFVHRAERYDFEWLIFTTVWTLLSLTSFIAGCGLLGRRPWARRWEVVYLGILSVVVAVEVVKLPYNIRRDASDFTDLVRFLLVFGLPLVPFLFGVVGGSTDATRHQTSGKKKPVSTAVGVHDRELDG
jgi:hypothetical protein